MFELLLSSLLAIATVTVAIADFSNVPVESPQGLRLGRFYLIDDVSAVELARAQIDKTGFAAAAKVFDAGLQRDPGSAYRWCDTGEALLHAGHPDRAERCYTRASELAPHDVRILLDIGDFYSTIGRPEPALRNFSAILRQSGAAGLDILTQNIFVYYEGLKVRQNHLLDLAIPDITNAAAYLHYAIQSADPAAAQEVWDWALPKHFDTDRMALDFTSFMFARQRYEAAAHAWDSHFGQRRDSRIFNGGFEYEIDSGVFDWQFGSPVNATGARDHQIHQAGEYSYRVDFTGNANPDFRDFKQTVYVRPGRYHFEAWMRTANIASDEGPRFRLRTATDRSHHAVETDALTGTRDWTRLDAEIDVPVGMPLLEISLVRHPSLRVANQLTGTVWIDSVKLTPR